ncbi:MAG: DUF2325 domain-containing protein [Epsilonproteobacteria bacterium]|nr:DUF2325 domain-containing protein [Campylobacterota bacterium]
MSILVIGGDSIKSVKNVLTDMGAAKITHWDGRKNHGCNAKSIPEGVDCVLMLTTFLNHNMMKKYKKIAKRDNVSLVCAKRSVGSVQEEFSKVLKRA